MGYCRLESKGYGPRDTASLGNGYKHRAAAILAVHGVLRPVQENK